MQYGIKLRQRREQLEVDTDTYYVKIRTTRALTSKLLIEGERQ